MKKLLLLSSTAFAFLLSGCSAYFNQPTNYQAARFGEDIFKNTYITHLTPVEPVVVGVYKFRDQTGQYKQVENGVSYSTAVTQGATTMLVKALEDSNWFVPIERENISNLLNERQIIRATRKELDKEKATPLPPLLFAGLLLEGGIISYDTNIITGGLGARYFGAGASTQYRQDRISIYLRAVSTSSGKILKTVYISKTILSQALDVNLFRYVKLKRLLEVETGISRNEPKQLAVKEAIEKAVEALIIEGVKDGIWKAREDKNVVDTILTSYFSDKEKDKQTSLLNRKLQQKSKNTITMTAMSNVFKGDYANSDYNFGGMIGYKHYFNKSYFNVNLSIGHLTLSNTEIFKTDYIVGNANFEYTILPQDKITPILYTGLGGYGDTRSNEKTRFKFQYGLGLEYNPSRNFGIRLFTEQNLLFTDELDNKIYGKYNDTYWSYGIGISVFSGK